MRPPSRRQRGFTLLELLIIVVILGIIFTILVPYFLDSLQKAKQKRTMANISAVGRAMMMWITDQAGAAAAGADSGRIDLGQYTGPTDPDSLRPFLVPLYIAHLPEHDAWGNDFEYYLDPTSTAPTGVLAIRSTGSDGTASSDEYTAGPFVSTNYAEDLVWADGLFFRWPQNWED